MLAKEKVVSEIDVKEAVRLAKEFATGIYEKEKISRLGLEAVERTEDGRYWLVTLGFSRPWTTPRSTQRQDPLRSPFEQAFHESRKPMVEREYKVFRVDAQSGEVIGMEMFAE